MFVNQENGIIKVHNAQNIFLGFSSGINMIFWH